MALKICIEDRYTRSVLSDEDRRAISIAFDVCVNWFDGTNSAFYRLAWDKKVSIRSLLAELEPILASTTETAVTWHARCEEFKAYLLRELEREKAANAIETAMKHAIAGGLDWRDFHEMVTNKSEVFSS